MQHYEPYIDFDLLLERVAVDEGGAEEDDEEEEGCDDSGGKSAATIAE